MKSQYNKITFFKTNDGQEVSNTAQIKVLGIYMNGNGNLHTHINKMRSTARKRLNEYKLYSQNYLQQKIKTNFLIVTFSNKKFVA